MNILELAKAGNVSFTLSSQDLRQFASDFAKELADAPKPEPTKQEKYLTADQVCELLSISRVSLWNWDNKGITKPVRMGNLKRYRMSDIEAMGK